METWEIVVLVYLVLGLLSAVAAIWDRYKVDIVLFFFFLYPIYTLYWIAYAIRIANEREMPPDKWLHWFDWIEMRKWSK